MARSRRMTRYVLRELAMPTLLGLFLYTFVLLMNHFFVVAEKALSKNLGADLTLRLFFVGVPRLLVLSIPMAFLLGTLIAVGRLSADHEWIALQGAGRGPGVLLRPLVLHGLLGTVVALANYNLLVPETIYLLRNLRGEILLAHNLAADLKPRVFYPLPLPDEPLLFVDEIRPGGQRRLEGVLLVQPHPDRGTTEVVLARYGDLYPDPDGDLGLVLDLYRGVWHMYDPSDPATYRLLAGGGQTQGFGRARQYFPLASYVQTLLSPPDRVVYDLGPRELWQEVRESRAELAELRAAERTASSPGLVPGNVRIAERRANLATIELHQRIALPLASLFFVVLALPLGIQRVRTGKGAGFALSLVVILVYWASFTLARNAAADGTIPAVLGPWAGNLVILPWAAWGLWRLRWRSSSGPAPGLASALRAVGSGLRRLLPRTARRRRRSAADPDATLPASGAVDAFGGTTNRFVFRLDRYVGLAYLRVVVFALASAYLVYALVESKNLMEHVGRQDDPALLLLRYFGYFWPGALNVVLPIACLIGATVAFTLLTRTGELVAIKAAGVSMRRATLPVLLLTLLASGLLYLVEDRIAPNFNRQAQVLKDQIIGRAPRTYGLPATGSWSFGPEGRHLYHYRFYDRERGVFEGLDVFGLDRRGPRIVDHRHAETARWTGEAWELHGGWYRTFPKDPARRIYEEIEGTVRVPLDPPSAFAADRVSLDSAEELSEQMSVGELREQIADLGRRGYDVTRLEVSLHGKFAQALAPFVMVLLGLPFAFKVGRRGSLYGIGVALGLVLVYWAALAVFRALGLETVLRPEVAAWAPNVLFGLVGAYLMLYVET